MIRSVFVTHHFLSSNLLPRFNDLSTIGTQSIQVLFYEFACKNSCTRNWDNVYFCNVSFHVMSFREFCRAAQLDNMVLFNNFIIFLSMVSPFFYLTLLLSMTHCKVSLFSHCKQYCREYSSISIIAESRCGLMAWPDPGSK